MIEDFIGAGYWERNLRSLKTCGRLVLSGILDSQIEMVKSRLLELAVVDFEIDQDGEWAALVI